jgi:hypothetical protein
MFVILIVYIEEDKTSSKLWKRIIDATLSNSSNDDQAAGKTTINKFGNSLGESKFCL